MVSELRVVVRWVWVNCTGDTSGGGDGTGGGADGGGGRGWVRSVRGRERG